MGFGKLLDWIGRLITAHAILTFILSAAGIVALAVYLATLTSVLRLFAPYSYLIAGLIALLFFGALAGLGLMLAKAAGWKPARRIRRPTEPDHDARMRAVVRYLVNESRFGDQLAGTAPEMWRSIDQEIMDRVPQRRMHVWGHYGAYPIYLVTGGGDWRTCQVNASVGVITRQPDNIGVHAFVYDNIWFNWGEVRRAWPRKFFIIRWLRKLRGVKPALEIAA